MRILGLEISRAPKRHKAVWSRASTAPMGLLISSMTPDELRRELTWVVGELQKGNYLLIGPKDSFRRVQSIHRDRFLATVPK